MPCGSDFEGVCLGFWRAGEYEALLAFLKGIWPAVLSAGEEALVIYIVDQMLTVQMFDHPKVLPSMFESQCLFLCIGHRQGQGKDED